MVSWKPCIALWEDRCVIVIWTMVRCEIAAVHAHEIGLFKQETPWFAYTSKSLQCFLRQLWENAQGEIIGYTFLFTCCIHDHIFLHLRSPMRFRECTAKHNQSSVARVMNNKNHLPPILIFIEKNSYTRIQWKPTVCVYIFFGSVNYSSM